LALLAFVADAETEAVIREALLEVLPTGVDVRRGNIRAASAALQKMPTPRTLIVDVSGEEQPLVLLGDLSHVVEPDVRVLVIGDREDVTFYRHVTRGLGAMEYLYKPLTRDMVARYFGPQITRQAVSPQNVHGGLVITVTGVRGGVGATTIAAHLAWHFGITARQHTVLLDPDLHMGSAAMLLDAKSSPGLRTALEAPQRIDELFVERVAQPVSGRLNVLAGEEALGEQPNFAPGAAERLIEALRRRYNLIVADVPFVPMPLYRDLLETAKQRVLVLNPNLAGVRDTLRLLALPNGPMQARRAVVVLNRLGMPGGLTRKQAEDALKMRVDVVIPDLPRRLGNAATMGEPASAMRGGFQSAIVQLAQEVAAVRALELPLAPAAGATQNRTRRRSLFGRRA
jgi:pilus assembly protein CpaE